MGCTCINSVSNAPGLKPQESLPDPIRYRAYPLKVSEPDYVLIYDYQNSESKIVHLLLEPELDDYSVCVNHPFIFVAGGVDRNTKLISNKIWITSAGSDEISMSNNKFLTQGRKLPSLIPGKEGSVYIIGGLLENGDLVKTCEKLNISDDSLLILPSLGIEHTQIMEINNRIYAFGKYDARNIIEIMDMNEDIKGWVSIVIQSNSPENPLVYLEDFGAFSTNKANDKLIIFGGFKSYSETKSEIINFDSNLGKLEISRFKLPNPARFLSPMIESNVRGFALDVEFRIHIYDKNSQKWHVDSTDIYEAIRKKGLTIQ